VLARLSQVDVIPQDQNDIAPFNLFNKLQRDLHNLPALIIYNNSYTFSMACASMLQRKMTLRL
jgi:hypothetical protein